MAGIYKRPDRDTWTVDYFDAAGVRHRLSLPPRAKKPKTCSHKRLRSIKESRGPQELVPDPNLTVAEYGERWLKQLPASGLKPRTIAGYTQLWNLHLEPALGRLKLRELGRSRVHAKHDHGLSKNTVRLIRACLSAALAEAVEDGLLSANPTALPSRRRSRKGVGSISAADRQKSIRPFSEAEATRLL